VIFLNRFLSEEELNLHLSAADMMILPYTEDAIAGASGALARCASLGKPIIATSIPRFQEDLKDGYNALLVEPSDVEGLVEALERLMGNPSLRGRIIENIGRWAMERRWKEIAMKIVKIYREFGRTNSK